MDEPNILKRLINKSNFVPKLKCSFQDYENLYLVTTFYNGPSLHQFIYINFSEMQIKFISACIILSFKYNREKLIIHRDLTVTNIVLDDDYYFNLIDFSFSIDYSKRNLKIFRCNYERMLNAPEIINGSDYSYNSDYYRLGCLIFYLIFKKHPIEPLKNYLHLIKEYKTNKKYSLNLLDFLEKLLIINYRKRLGYRSINELINHQWLKDINWKKLEEKKIISPFANIKPKIRKTNCKRFDKDKNMVINFTKLINKEDYIRIANNFQYP